MVRKHIFFSGDVQGVGFRYRSFYIAQSLGLAGWVENLWDGRVEMEVQGSEVSIREMLARIQQQRWINVADMEITEIPCEEERGFKTKIKTRGMLLCLSIFPIIQANFGQRMREMRLFSMARLRIWPFRRFRKVQSNHWLSQWS